MPTIKTTTTVIDVKEGVSVRPIKIKLNGAGSRGGGNGRRGGGGGGGNNNSGGGGSNSGGSDQPQRFSPTRYWVGTYIALAAVLMTFATLVTAYVARVGASKNWRPVELPRLLWLSTALILVSSAAFELARRALKRRAARAFERWLWLTLLLGVSFLAAQIAVFNQLAAQGVYLASNPYSAFFYILTGAHAVHLMGGIVALTYLLLLRQRQARQFVKSSEREAQQQQRTISDVIAIYWHFIDGIWVFLFALLFLWK